MWVFNLCVLISYTGWHISEILLLSKTVKFPFPTMDHSPWSSKNLIIWNRLKKFMQVEVNVLCMHSNFDECRHSGFGDIATFKNNKFPFPTSNGHQKI